MFQNRVRLTIFVLLVSLMLIRTPFVSGQSLELIEWHESVKTDAIFAWKVSSVDLINDSMAGFLSGLIIQMKFTANPPSDPARIFNATEPPNWVNMYINGFKIELDQMGEMGGAFTQLISPIRYHFDNGTSFTLEEIHRLATPTEGLDTYYTVENGFVNTTIGNESIQYTTFTNIETGIVKNISIYLEEMGSFQLEYYVQAANVDDSGESTAISDDYTNFQDPIAMFRNLILLAGGAITGIVVLGIAFVLYRRRSRPIDMVEKTALEIV